MKEEQFISKLAVENRLKEINGEIIREGESFQKNQQRVTANNLTYLLTKKVLLHDILENCTITVRVEN